MIALQTTPPSPSVLAIGLMSGTSLDGIDAAVIRTDGEQVFARGAALTVPYEKPFRSRLRSLLGCAPQPDWQPLVAELTRLHADAVAALLTAAGLDAGAIAVVGFHGQTVLHRPQDRQTVQLGDGAALADRIGIAVVNDFRSADVLAGGQGAPLVPLYHAALARRLVRPLAVLNLGGVANVTYLPADSAPQTQPLAFDTGPGNALIDDWVAAATGAPFDSEGRLAAAGRVDDGLIAAWLARPYFHQRPPKSLDRDEFRPILADLAGTGAADGAATLTAFTARAVAAGLCFLPELPRRWLVTGGGRHNPVLIKQIAEALAAPVEAVEAVGWDGDSLEAEAFAFLAVRSLRGLPLSLPSTTGVGRPQCGGVLHRPRRPAERSPDASTGCK